MESMLAYTTAEHLTTLCCPTQTMDSNASLLSLLFGQFFSLLRSELVCLRTKAIIQYLMAIEP